MQYVWYVSYGGTGRWMEINTSRYRVKDLAFGDFNGDGKTDVFRADGRKWYVSYGGNGPWVRLADSGYRVKDLAFGDFNGDGKTDVFRADGRKWYVSHGGNGPWVRLAGSGYRVKDLAFGDFNGDGKTDVFRADGRKWYVSHGGTGRWVKLSDSRYRVNDLAFGDFNGDGKTDVFRADGRKWYVSYGGTGRWVKLSDSRYRLKDLAFGDFNGDGKTDVFAVNVRPVIEKQTVFDPIKHGFKFDNNFDVHPSILGIDLGSWEMGLCGGMCAGALYRFKNNIPIPTTTQTPQQGTDLFDELMNRQIRSIPPDVISKIHNWQSAPDRGHWYGKHSVGYRTKKEWPKLKRKLDADEPTNLILIRVEGYTANITKNHQVLAIGYRYNRGRKDLTVKIYDPNCQNVINELSMNFRRNRINAKDSSGKRLRGFFVNPAGKAASS